MTFLIFTALQSRSHCNLHIENCIWDSEILLVHTHMSFRNIPNHMAIALWEPVPYPSLSPWFQNYGSHTIACLVVIDEGDWLVLFNIFLLCTKIVPNTRDTMIKQIIDSAKFMLTQWREIITHSVTTRHAYILGTRTRVQIEAHIPYA